MLYVFSSQLVGLFYFEGTMKTCSVEGCGGKLFLKEYCQKHYWQMRRHGKILERTIYDPNKITIKDDIAEIVLYNKKGKEIAKTIIDAEDADRIKNHKWHMAKGYVETSRNGKNILLQNMIMNITSNKKQMADHKDRNTLNNRKSNYRLCSHVENCRNKGVSEANSSGFKGVYWHKNKGKWQSQIKINQNGIYLGLFKDKIKAAKAYNKAAIKYFGEFACLNKI